ncbi:MAG: ACP S-malonyltransferase [Gammaproteobacteria bacterium]|nr:ACP S-malonyltransferase [Gammaproteobacteria bacterium]MDH4253889.1 ACP S-malonyltransferase [Gammaproteobacteria bacterium]MDH5309798.1 ACP S-malonyltransferase [Gammaproteobacteria bacterium]MDH5502292.1 ACP S-malonyltransferase [Gammaproteobacteria bacterium]
MVFPGQGSQSVGMQAELAAIYPQIRETYDEASDLLGFDLWMTVQDGPREVLDRTTVTQPAMLTAGVAAWRAWCRHGGRKPAIMAGHSLGEFTALVCAESISFQDALNLVRARARYMQEASPQGDSAMAAVLGLSDKEVIDICDNASGIGIAEPVNFNSPGQVVISGHKGAVQRAVVLAKEQGARRAILLHVSVASHSTLMRPAGDALAENLAEVEVRPPKITVISATDVRPYKDGDDIRHELRRQVSSPVQWVLTTRALIELGATKIVECGPGNVLAGLCRRIDRSVTAICLDAPESFADAMNQEYN